MLLSPHTYTGVDTIVGGTIRSTVLTGTHQRKLGRIGVRVPTGVLIKPAHSHNGVYFRLGGQHSVRPTTSAVAMNNYLTPKFMRIVFDWLLLAPSQCYV